jgi:hypothetical protein
MNGPVILHTIREQLADEIFSYGEPIPAPLKISPWLAMSLLQIGDVPSYAYDVYSREGRLALQALLQRDCETARWVRDHTPGGKGSISLGRWSFAWKAVLFASGQDGR